MTVMGTSHDYDNLVHFTQNMSYSFKVSEVEWLEPANIEAGRQLSGPGWNPKGLRSNSISF